MDISFCGYLNDKTYAKKHTFSDIDIRTSANAREHAKRIAKMVSDEVEEMILKEIDVYFDEIKTDNLRAAKIFNQGFADFYKKKEVR